MTDRRPIARQAGLLIVSFIATLAILAGLLAESRAERCAGSDLVDGERRLVLVSEWLLMGKPTRSERG